MGDYMYMLEQVEEKLKEGFRCVKLKIGAIDFDRELSLLKHIRAHFSAKEIELRVDANGAFTPSVASALESQIGLNAIAQWCATLGNPLPQGLGTGEIFKDDKHRLIQRKGDTIWFTNDL